MKQDSFRAILWMAISEAGFIAGLIATAVQLLGLTGIQVAVVFIGLLVVLSISILNIRLYLINKTQEPFIEYVQGHEKTFELLTRYIKSANESFWVTRFSQSNIMLEQEYFNWTFRKISGDGCKPLLNYRRIMSIDNHDKADLACDFLEKFSESKNFFLRKTSLNLFFELIIIDSKYAIVTFHELGYINSGLLISKPEIVAKLREVFERIWSHEKTEIIKEKAVLTQEEKQSLISEYSELASRLSY